MNPIKRYSRLNLVIIATLSICFILSGCGKVEPYSQKTSVMALKKEARTTEVKMGDISVTVSGEGTLKPVRTTSLYYENLSGSLKKLLIKENDIVKAGQIVAEINPTDINNKIADQEIQVINWWPVRMEQLNENLRMAEANLNRVKLELDSAQKTNSEKDNIERLSLQYDQQNNAYQNALWNKKLGQIEYQRDRRNLQGLRKTATARFLKSPVNGTVVFVEPISLNETIYPGMVIARIEDANNTIFQMTTSEAKYISGAADAMLKLNNSYNVTLYDPQTSDELNRGPNQIFLKFNSSIPKTEFNKIVKAQLTITKHNVLLIPKSVFYEQNGKYMVDALLDNKTQKVEIKRGLADSDMVEVISGLSVGQQVIERSKYGY